MNLNCLHITNSKNNIQFGNNFYNRNQELTKKIKYTLSIISKSFEYRADIGTIAKLSGLKEEEVYDCLFDGQNYELYNYWQNILRESIEAQELTTKAPLNESSAEEIEPAKISIQNPKTIESINTTVKFIDREPINIAKRILTEDKQIESAMYQILNNPELDSDIETLAQITGLAKQKITSRIYASTNNLYNFWQYVQAVKEGDSPERRRNLMKFYRVKDETFTYTKTKNPKLALKMIKESVKNKSKISYRAIEHSSGLDKNEIDTLVYSYAKSLQEQARLVQSNKELQAKWYKENTGTI